MTRPARITIDQKRSYYRALGIFAETGRELALANQTLAKQYRQNYQSRTTQERCRELNEQYSQDCNRLLGIIRETEWFSTLPRAEEDIRQWHLYVCLDEGRYGSTAEPDLGYLEYVIAHCKQVKKHSMWERIPKTPWQLAREYRDSCLPDDQMTLF